jgi:hypothetical protein
LQYLQNQDLECCQDIKITTFFHVLYIHKYRGVVIATR